MSKAKGKGDILNVIKQAVNEVFEEKEVVTRADLKYLPSKEEYFEREDRAMGKLKKIEEELSMLSAHSKEQYDKIEKLESIHPQGKHSLATT